MKINFKCPHTITNASVLPISKSLKYQLDMYILFWYKQTLNNFGLDRDDNILKETQW